MPNKAIVESWRPWLDSNIQIGGYTERYRSTADKGLYGQLVFATVRGAGHMVPQYKPLRAFDLFGRFLLNTTL